MKLGLRVKTVAVSLLFMSASAWADQQPDTSKLEQLGIEVMSIKPSGIEGVFELSTNQGIVYLSEDGENLLAGSLYKLSTGAPENKTEQALQTLRKAKVAEHQDEMITYRSSKEKHVVTIFTDTTCGYCQRLHNNLGSYLDKGITVQYLAFPRGGLGSKGGRELQQAWCAKDGSEALSSLFNEQAISATTLCDNPVAQHYRLGQMLGVTGTPALILPDGRMLAGLRTPDAIINEIQAAR
ncbi:bifunctional protein-disulfide isomerase/oxidoreductase DsbC [Idiomarina sp. UBA3162]|uniref:bifunctional protein-disulfide isomerase/oxidoreductase DsbC n=1 Tax=Idiomarina sp. UBA3162 TaxID=1946641 RepID=UPI000C95796B|nr:bifunctional protein-disulfide isomerase/oxidoreductase DsbC [Idiomarina sp. UBA3162]MAD54337.1 bifunctional protein-disulfide isomerase/oxidoreductase DsbC [Idiomarinaceae bacterium]|tara:strand:- start:2844 stop:3560 length:717 start_codon:yes stop_codon:yes gene_type:complete